MRHIETPKSTSPNLQAYKFFIALKMRSFKFLRKKKSNKSGTTTTNETFLQLQIIGAGRPSIVDSFTGPPVYPLCPLKGT
jgi:hypothetical protein